MFHCIYRFPPFHRLYGLGVATVWASTMMYMENTVGLSGVYMTALTVSASTGDAILPILMGVAFEQIGPLGVIYICLFALIGSNVLIIVVMKYISCYQTNRVPSVPKHDEKQEMQQEDTNVVN